MKPAPHLFRASAADKTRPNAKRIPDFLLSSVLSLVLVLYGLKWIVTSDSKPTHSADIALYHLIGSFRLVPVKIMAAALTCLGGISFAIYGNLSYGLPPDEDRSWRWRINRAILRWVSLAATYFLWYEAYRLLQ